MHIRTTILAWITIIIWRLRQFALFSGFALSEYVQGLIVLTVVLLTMAGIGTWILYLAVRAQYSRVKTGAEALIGTTGIAITDLNPKGEIRVMGEFWQAISRKASIKNGQMVEIVSMDGMFLVVKPAEEKV